MDTKPLLDFLENIPSVAQIGEAKESFENRIAQLNDLLEQRFAELNTKIADLQRENAELSEMLDNCVKVIANNTALIDGIAKIINERRDETLPSTPSTEPSPSTTPSIPSEPSTPSEPSIPITPSSPTPSIEEEIVEDNQPEEHKSSLETIADSIHVEESLAEKLSKTVDHNTVASALNTSHIESIKSTITIADRFRFQRELFSGNGALMGSTIDELDAMSTLAEAEAYIAKNFTWSTDNQAVQDFLSILARRY